MRSISLLPSLVLILTAVLALPAAHAADDAFPVTVHEKTLSNGMKVLVMPREGVPNVSCAIAYDVGSANERPGQTGMAHYLEHMMFKGTEKMGVKDLALDAKLRGELDGVMAETVRLEDAPESPETVALLDALQTRRAQLIEEQKQNLEINHLFTIYREGGSTFTNAMTGNDWTTYIAALPPEKVELFFWVEADRLQHCIFRQFHAEKDVVREERRMYENRPGALFREGVQQAIFGSHPYSHPILGYHEDLRRLTRDELRGFFSTYYAPDNATVLIGGDVEPARIFALAERYFGRIAAPDIERPRVPVLRVPRSGEIRLEGRGAGRTSLDLYWRVPAGGTEEALALQLLAMHVGDDEGALQKDLIEKQKVALSMFANYDARKFGGVLHVSAKLAPGSSHDAVEKRIAEAITAVRDTPLSDDAMASLRRRYRARILGAVQSDMAIGFLILRREMAGSWKDIDRDLVRVKTLPAEALQQVAREYLVPENAVVTRYTKDDEAAKPTPAAAPVPAHRDAVPAQAAVATPEGELPASWTDLEYAERPFEIPSAAKARRELQGGIPAFVVPSRGAPMVKVSATILGGSAVDPVGKEGLSAMAADVLGESGIAGLSPKALKEHLDDLVASVATSSDVDTHSIVLTAFPADLDEGLRLLRGLLEAPELDEAAFQRTKDAMLARIDNRHTRIRGVTSRLYRELLWGDVPETRRPTRESVESITLDNVRAHLQSVTGPGRLLIAAAGDMEADALAAKLDKALEGWKPDGVAPYTPRTTKNDPEAAARGLHVRPMAMSQGSVRIGQTTVPGTHEQAPALRVLANVLSRRVFNTIRSIHGLAYQAGTRFTPSWHNDSPFTFMFQTKCASVPFAIDLAMQELRKIREEGPTAEEIADTTRGLDSSFRRTFGQGFGTAQRFRDLEIHGVDLDYDRKLRNAIRAVDAEAVKAAATRHVDPAKLLVLCVGDVEAMKDGDGQHPQKLSDLGAITRHEAPTAKAPNGPDAIVRAVFDALRAGDMDTVKKHSTAKVKERLENAPGIEEQLGMFRQMLQTATIGDPETTVEGAKASSRIPVEAKMGEQAIQLALLFDLVKDGDVWKCDGFRAGP